MAMACRIDTNHDDDGCKQCVLVPKRPCVLLNGVLEVPKGAMKLF